MPRLQEIDDRLRAANVLILGVDFDLLTKRVHFTIQPDLHWRGLPHGTSSMMEHILQGVPGETIITDERKEVLKFNAADDCKSFTTIVTHHSYLLINGTYHQELGSDITVEQFLRAPLRPQPVRVEVEL
jgi:hypothetical protein